MNWPRHGSCRREDAENYILADMYQPSSASAECMMKKKRTRREKFLANMERVVPWARLVAVIEPLGSTPPEAGTPPSLPRTETPRALLLCG